MLPTIVFIVLLVSFFAALGRGATPKAERLPWTGWGAKDLIANVVIGARRLVQLHQRDPRLPPLEDRTGAGPDSDSPGTGVRHD